MNIGAHGETNTSQNNAGFQVMQKEKEFQFAQMVNPQLKLKDGTLLSEV